MDSKVLSLAFLLFVLCSVPVSWAEPGKNSTIPVDRTVSEVVESGVHFAQSVQVGDVLLQLNGTGTRKATLLRVKVYAAALYVSNKSPQPETLLRLTTPSVVSMQFLRSVSAERLREGWKEGVLKNTSSSPELVRALNQFNDAMRDVVDGDKVVLTLFPNERVEVRIAGDAPVVIESTLFPMALLRVWLGSFPPNEDLKRGLLGR
ncbi:MAG: chalcone isomerase family protein [Bdellovibrionales bacterium]|nr:chalcone isomerase family protein [Bdellovibrionales bacterium]